MSLICSVLGVSAPEDDVAIVSLGGLVMALSWKGQEELMAALAPEARKLTDVINEHERAIDDVSVDTLHMALEMDLDGISPDTEIVSLETQEILNRSRANVEVAKADLVSTMVKWIRQRRAQVDAAKST